MKLRTVLISVSLVVCLLTPVWSAGVLESNLEAMRSVKGAVLDQAESFAARSTDTLMQKTSSLLDYKSTMIKDHLTSKLNTILGVKGNIIKGVISTKKALISKMVDAIIDAKLKVIKSMDSQDPSTLPPPAVDADENKPQVSVDSPQPEINNVVVEVQPIKISPDEPHDCSIDCLLRGIKTARRVNEELASENPVLKARIYEIHRSPRVYLPYETVYGNIKK